MLVAANVSWSRGQRWEAATELWPCSLHMMKLFSDTVSTNSSDITRGHLSFYMQLLLETGKLHFQLIYLSANHYVASENWSDQYLSLSNSWRLKQPACWSLLCVLLHLTSDLSVAEELLTVWEVEACSSPASCSSCVSMWQESRCSCSSSWDMRVREQRGQLKVLPLWPMCWLLMCSCISSSPPNTAGQYVQFTADAAEPAAVETEHHDTVAANITARATEIVLSRGSGFRGYWRFAGVCQFPFISWVILKIWGSKISHISETFYMLKPAPVLLFFSKL